MPSAQHPQAKFDPVSPDIDLSSLVERTPNFKWVQRVSRAQIRNLGQQEFEKLVAIHVVAGGKPLVIDGWDSVLPPGLFNVNWLEKVYDKKQENVRDIPNTADIPMTMGHYLRSMKQLTNQWSPHTYRDERRQRLYLKDIDCPNEWRDALQRIINPSLFYLNGNVTTTGKAQLPNDIFQNETTAAPAGDLMSSLPKDMQAQNLMCYIGHEGTYTPAHREMCASLGQNIMVEASGDERGEKPGSSIWFMTESKDREVVREYFLSMLGHDIEIEKHFAQINAWKKAPFDVYIVDQQVGDFILIPPLAAHQVWNRGTRTIKVAWNRTTVETLDLALHEALPKARLVCRDEQYKNKAIIYFTLQKYNAQLQEMETKSDMSQLSFMSLGQDIIRNSPRRRQLGADFKKLFDLYTQILMDEMFGFKEKEVEFLPFDSCVTCSYCRSNIFNRFLTCKHCIRTLANGDEDAYDVCMECYAMGRSCACLSGLQWCEQWLWSDLINSYESWRATVLINDGFVDLKNSPQPLEIARQRQGKKSVAQICQEALRRRPWKDITKPEPEKSLSESELGESHDKANRKARRKKKKGEVRRCHVCCHPDYSYRVHICTNPGCTEAYCYGVLYRAFDLMPQKVLEDEHWQCPKCLGICNCGHCRRAGNTKPYTPKNTSLGHDTRRIADDRSIEALVDFRIHNLSWLKAAGEESRSKDSRRMQRLREQADNAKARDLTEQVEAERKMQNGDAPTVDLTGGTGGTLSINGYGDQSHVLDGGEGTTVYSASDEPHDMPRDREAASNPFVTSSRMNHKKGAFSLYPDPSVFARQRIGMGYYEQDDTPDKILFDPYQAPSSESLKFDEPDVPEFVKKSIRAAKRKARRENEDPDFVMSKSHLKKPRLDAESGDFFNAMDPALFMERPDLTATMPVLDPQPTSSNMLSNASSMGQQDKKCSSNENAALPRFDNNEPALRHAKPRASYVEVDDIEVDDLDESLSASHPAGNTAMEADVNERIDKTESMHLRSRAIIMNLSDHNLDVSRDQESQLPSYRRIPKRRGRPPKPQVTPVSSGNSIISGLQDVPAESGLKKRGRGRPRKSTTILETAALQTALSRSSEDRNTILKGHTHSNGSESTVYREKPERINGGEPKEIRKPPLEDQRCSNVTAIAAGSLVHISPTGDRAVSHVDGGANHLPRGRGRPPKLDLTPDDGSEFKPPGTSESQFMSMAERMALRGRTFRIGKSRSSNVTRTQDEPRPPNYVVDQQIRKTCQETRDVIMEEERQTLEKGKLLATSAPDSSVGPQVKMPSVQTDGITQTHTRVSLADGTEMIDHSVRKNNSDESTDDEDIPSSSQAQSSDGPQAARRRSKWTNLGRKASGRVNGMDRRRGKRRER